MTAYDDWKCRDPREVFRRVCTHEECVGDCNGWVYYFDDDDDADDRDIRRRQCECRCHEEEEEDD